jgi:NDP-sugar pyrophosphorylase family protein
MQAIVLAGGVGTRLRPFTVTVPKPLLPIGDKPILGILLEQLKEQGFDRVCICVGYLAPLFQAWFGDGSATGIRIEYVVEENPLGTAGALALVRNPDENFVVINGDTLTDLNFRDLLCTHTQSRAFATIFSSQIQEFVDYGVVEFDAKSGRLNSFTEKPTRQYYVSTGIYALSRQILGCIEWGPDHRLDMPDLLRTAADNGHPVVCYVKDDCYWRDIGRFDHYEAASKEYLEKPERFSAKPKVHKL